MTGKNQANRPDRATWGKDHKSWSFRLYMASVALFAVVLLFSMYALAWGSAPDSDLRFHHNNRVSFIQRPDCSFMPVIMDGVPHCLRWSGSRGVEFLNGGGIFVKLIENGKKEVIANPGNFSAVQGGCLGQKLYEGCQGGLRGGSERADDDGDGTVDEDMPDGMDNDGDSAIDEDFSAFGDEMMVSSSVDAKAGIRIVHESLSWGYGHMRDFLCFRTFISRIDTCEIDTSSCTLDVSLAIDFDIGRPEDRVRGEDDKFMLFTIQNKRCWFRFLAARDGTDGSGFVALVPFGAHSLSGGEFLNIEGVVYRSGLKDSKSASRVVSPFERKSVLFEEKIGLGDGSRESKAHLEQYIFSFREISTGDCGLSLMLSGIGGMGARLDWALVFGETEEILVRNVVTALRTYEGIRLADGTNLRWIAPARKARLLTLEPERAIYWGEGEKRETLVLTLPAGLEFEDVEWLKINGSQSDAFEKFGKRIFVKLESSDWEEGVVGIEGQLTDGTIVKGTFHAEVEAAGSSADEGKLHLPEDALQLYPNPFVSTVNINLHLYSSGKISISRFDIAGTQSSIKVYDVQGRLVRTIFETESFQPGYYNFTWDGLDRNGSRVSPGVYYCKLQVGRLTLTKRVILLR